MNPLLGFEDELYLSLLPTTNPAMLYHQIISMFAKSSFSTCLYPIISQA